MTRALARSSLRYFGRHRWQTVLAVLGIALGVAVMIAVDIANSSARRAFGLTLDRIAGRATHQIEAASGSVPEGLYPRLRVDRGIDAATPVVEGTARVGGQSFTLLGVDPFSQRAFRDPSWRLERGDTAGLLTRPDGLVISAADAERLGLGVGDPISLDVAGRPLTLRILGLLRGEDEATSAGLLVTDIATAQEVLGRIGVLDRIDLILTAEHAAAVQASLPPGLRLTSASRRSASLTSMTEAFHLNLAAMSLLAVLVGGFIIYNAMTFAVLQRRPLLGSLRSLGVTRGQIFSLILLEALVLGLIGIAIGLFLGIVTGRGLVQLVTRTINDLYFTVTVNRFFLEPRPLIQGTLVGLVVTLFAASIPALEAARSEPHDTLRHALIERRGGRLLPWLSLAGGALLLGGLALAAVPSRSLNLGFTSLLLIVLGYCLAVPQMLVAFCGGLTRLLGDRLGLRTRLALRGLTGSVSRTGVAVAALTLAVAATIGVGIMINSFRASVADWLNATLRSDLYVSALSGVSNRTDGILPAGLDERIRSIPGVAQTSTGRSARIESSFGPVILLAIDRASKSHRGFQFKGGVLDDLWTRFEAGELVLVSEPFAYRHGLGAGDRLELLTNQGPHSFVVGAVFYDYGTDGGMLLLPRALYARLWDDPAISTVGVVLADPAEAGLVEERIRALVGTLNQTVRVRSNRAIRDQSMDVFDRTFTVTRVLRLLAMGVAFIGILSSLMALQIERSRDYAILRATGVTPRELAGLISLQTGLVGVAAGLFALPLGVLMARLLIEVVNVRSFGWTIQMQVSVTPVASAILLAVAAALLAGLYPAWRVTRTEPASALRDK